MSIDVLRAELQQIIESSDYDKLLRMRESVLEEEHIPDPNSEDWWDELPQHVKESLERGLKESRAGLGIPHEEVMKMYPQWFRTSK